MKENICPSCGAKNFIDVKKCAYCNSPLSYSQEVRKETTINSSTQANKKTDSGFASDITPEEQAKQAKLAKKIFLFFFIFVLVIIIFFFISMFRTMAEFDRFGF